MSEIEYSITVDGCFGDVKVCADEVDYNGIEEPVEEFGEEFCAFIEVGAGEFGCCWGICWC